MKIVGRGLIGSAFIASRIEDEDLVLIASGVSNSSEVCLSAFQRERQVIERCLNEGDFKTVFFISSCSVRQKNTTPYVRHKLAMEELVMNSGIDYYIFRLPQVVGQARNNTLVSYFLDSILSGVPIRLNISAKRYLIAVSDVVRVADMVYKTSSKKNIIIDVAPKFSISALDIYSEIMKIVGVNSINVTLITAQDFYAVDTSLLESIILPGDDLFNEDYSYAVLRREVPSMLALRGTG